MSNPEQRYRAKPFIGSSHSWALDQCRSLTRDSKVLDVGTGSGVIGAALKELGFSQLYGVEIDASARRHSAEFYQKISDDLKDYEAGTFDLVLLLDVIEHTTDPALLLNQALAKLKPGGLALVSVPNIAHWSIRLSLLFGRFEYTSRGILDRTHFSFFTKRRLRQLIGESSAGDLLSIAASIAPIEFLLPQAVWDNAVFAVFAQWRKKVAQILPGLFGFQLLAVIRKRG